MSREKELKIIFHPEDSTYTSRSVKPLRPAITSPPPSYNTAIGASNEDVERKDDGPGMVQAGVMSGVGIAALYCAKLAYELYYPSEVKHEEKTMQKLKK